MWTEGVEGEKRQGNDVPFDRGVRLAGGGVKGG